MRTPPSLISLNVSSPHKHCAKRRELGSSFFSNMNPGIAWEHHRSKTFYKDGQLTHLPSSLPNFMVLNSLFPSTASGERTGSNRDAIHQGHAICFLSFSIGPSRTLFLSHTLALNAWLRLPLLALERAPPTLSPNVLQQVGP